MSSTPVMTTGSVKLRAMFDNKDVQAVSPPNSPVNRAAAGRYFAQSDGDYRWRRLSARRRRHRCIRRHPRHQHRQISATVTLGVQDGDKVAVTAGLEASAIRWWWMVPTGCGDGADVEVPNVQESDRCAILLRLAQRTDAARTARRNQFRRQRSPRRAATISKVLLIPARGARLARGAAVPVPEPATPLARSAARR